MFPVITEICGGEWCMYLQLFPVMKFFLKLVCRQVKPEVRKKLTAIALIKANFWLPRAFCAARQFPFELCLLNQCWSYWICILMYLGSIRKKYIIYHIVFISSIASSNKCSAFNFFYFTFFFQDTRLLINRIFLNTLFEKGLKTIHWHLCYI